MVPSGLQACLLTAVVVLPVTVILECPLPLGRALGWLSLHHRVIFLSHVSSSLLRCPKARDHTLLLCVPSAT